MGEGPGHESQEDAFRRIHQPMSIVAYDPSWPARFEEKRTHLWAAIGAWVVGGIHQVGSTAVPGLAAKPVIDILAGVRDVASSRVWFEPLARLGYMYAAYRADEMHWFCKPHLTHRTHHLHLVPVDAKRYREELAFRDRLRSHPAEARSYEGLKRRLAVEFEHDREGYTTAKSAFIRALLDRS